MINEHNNSKQKQTLPPNNTQIPLSSHLDTIPQTKTNLRRVAGMHPHNVTHANPRHSSSSPPHRATRIQSLGRGGPWSNDKHW